MRRLAALLVALAPAGAGAIELSWPVACVLDRTCHIQHYVDRDPGPGTADYRCGTLTNDGHKGTDIRLPDRAAMRRGVDVLAAAPGRVVGLRDGMPDIAQGEPGAPELRGRDCGNGVVLRHAGGWSTQYCHLARGSLRVAEGETVPRGAPLGRIGLSGNSQFPHLHITLRDPQDRVVDPFDARAMDASCTFPDRADLWAEGTDTAYRGGGALAAGFSDGVPDYSAVREGLADRPALPPEAPAIVFWAHFFGLRAGDRLVTRLLDPAGAVVAEDALALDRTRATQLRAVGLRNRGRLSVGRWRGEAVLMRDGQEHARIGAALAVDPVRD